MCGKLHATRLLMPPDTPSPAVLTGGKGCLQGGVGPSELGQGEEGEKREEEEEDDLQTGRTMIVEEDAEGELTPTARPAVQTVGGAPDSPRISAEDRRERIADRGAEDRPVSPGELTEEDRAVEPFEGLLP